MPKNPFKIKSSPMSSPERQSPGILDDFAIRKNIDTKAGTIQKVPVNAKDVVNKEYVDDNTISLLDVYPVGAVYMSVVSTSPATLFGGTWQAISTGRVLVGYDGDDPLFNDSEKTGGAQSVTLTEAQIPSHTHDQQANTMLNDGAVHIAKVDTTAPVTRNVGGTTQSTGGGEAHTNIQQYFVVYMWKRTA